MSIVVIKENDTIAVKDVGVQGSAGQGLPTGGAVGQVPVKQSTTDYDTAWQTLAGSGDMLQTIYDPNTIATDAFDMDSMVEGATTKILTDTERTAISDNSAKTSYTDAAQVATNKTNADASKVKTDFISVTQAVDLDTIEADTATNNLKVGVTNEEQNTINTNLTGEPTGSDLVLNVVSLTQAEYDAGTPVATTLYIIT